MAFNTTSYLAGVGTVVAALTIGFSSGFFFAAPTQNEPPNRLQRVASSAPLANQAATPAPSAPTQEIPKQDVAAAGAVPTAAAAPAPVASSPPAAVAAPTPVASVSPAPSQQAVSPEPAPVVATAPEPAPAAAAQERIAQINADKAAERIRAVEASRAAERKRVEARKLADRQRKQREVQEAATAVKRMLRDRDVQQVADTDGPGFDTPRLGFFGQ